MDARKFLSKKWGCLVGKSFFQTLEKVTFIFPMFGKNG